MAIMAIAAVACAVFIAASLFAANRSAQRFVPEQMRLGWLDEASPVCWSRILLHQLIAFDDDTFDKATHATGWRQFRNRPMKPLLTC
ncbi:hypothetical protein [Bradyrhizobium sp. LjRoot220]|uniref:hypothetical protein n=1 Tax=Bradyrhizobium sp. LjRoot220 TaxID=3342284 RepID=UPI003F50D44B